LAKPTIDFFQEKELSLKDLAGRAKGRTLVIFEKQAPRGKIDIVGAKMKKLFEHLENSFVKEDFIVKERGWSFNSVTRFWFYFDRRALKKKKLHFGPPVSLKKEHISGFRKAWKGHKITKSKGRYAVELERKFVKPEQLARKLAKELKLKIK
jgi:tRNA nucleotidyltransferase (CCA-adding enzyme)